MSTPPDRDTWLQHALRQAPWRTETQATSLVLAVVVVVALIGALYLAQASRTAAAGRRVQSLEAERQVLEQTNAQLRAEIAALRSVPRLIAEAEKLGYQVASVDQVDYMTLDIPAPPPRNPAQRTGIPALDAAFVPEPMPVYDETLPGWLAARTEAFREALAEFARSTFGARGSEEEPQ